MINMELDTTKLKQAGFRKTVSHDNCNVLDIGSGSFPRYIEVRPPGDDGSRMTAIWDGILNLAVNDKVICIEYAGNPIWRVNAIGGGGSGVGTVRVNKVFASDFSSESLVTDASDNITINTGTLTLPSDIIHLGDSDNKISFTDDVQTFTVGGLVMLTLTETTQDLINLGPGSGDIDIDFNGDMFLQGSDGFIGIGPAFQTPTSLLHLETTTGTAGVAYFKFVSSNEGGGFSVVDQAGTGFLPGFRFDGVGVSGFGGILIGTLPTADDAQVANRAAMVFDGRLDTNTFLANANVMAIRNFTTTLMTIDVNGLVGLNGVTTPSTELDIGAGAMEFNEMTAPGAGAVNTTRLYAEDSGGTTRQQIVFNGGNTVTIAQDGGLQTYTPTNVVTDRSYDANATSVAELADVLGTLIADFQAAGVLG